MADSHRHGDARTCGATTIVSGQNFVTIDGKLWSVEGDQDSHGAGQLIAGKGYITIGGKKIIVVGDTASPDGLCGSDGGEHCSPKSSSGSGTVTVA
jgi:uncharacterized Zn-binding protein involved in type VI secretion